MTRDSQCFCDGALSVSRKWSIIRSLPWVEVDSAFINAVRSKRLTYQATNADVISANVTLRWRGMTYRRTCCGGLLQDGLNEPLIVANTKRTFGGR